MQRAAARATNPSWRDEPGVSSGPRGGRGAHNDGAHHDPSHAWVERQRTRPLIDLVHHFFNRDAEAAGGVLGSAVAFRVFLFFVPLVLFVFGLLGFLSAGHLVERRQRDGLGSVASWRLNPAGVRPVRNRPVRGAPHRLFGAAWAGRSLTIVLVGRQCPRAGSRLQPGSEHRSEWSPELWASSSPQ